MEKKLNSPLALRFFIIKPHRPLYLTNKDPHSDNARTRDQRCVSERTSLISAKLNSRDLKKNGFIFGIWFLREELKTKAVSEALNLPAPDR